MPHQLLEPGQSSQSPFQIGPSIKSVGSLLYWCTLLLLDLPLSADIIPWFWSNNRWGQYFSTPQIFGWLLDAVLHSCLWPVGASVSKTLTTVKSHGIGLGRGCVHQALLTPSTFSYRNVRSNLPVEDEYMRGLLYGSEWYRVSDIRTGWLNARYCLDRWYVTYV